MPSLAQLLQYIIQKNINKMKKFRLWILANGKKIFYVDAETEKELETYKKRVVKVSGVTFKIEKLD